MRFVPQVHALAGRVPLCWPTLHPGAAKAPHPTNKAYDSLLLMFFNNEIAPGQRISITELAEPASP